MAQNANRKSVNIHVGIFLIALECPGSMTPSNALWIVACGAHAIVKEPPNSVLARQNTRPFSPYRCRPRKKYLAMGVLRKGDGTRTGMGLSYVGDQS